jgi:DtxR family transcriptional regulator, Mn-dependent transcriptional regulator
MAQISNLSTSLEDYLEIILQLVLERGEARVKEIAERKSVRMASVTGALKRLATEGLIDYKARETVALTRNGHELANKVLQRHEFISRFLTEVLGVSEETSSRDACAIEHEISLETLDRLAAFMEFLKSCPKVDKGLVQRFRECYGVEEKRHFGQSALSPSCRAEECLQAYPVRFFSRVSGVVPLSDLQPGDRGRVVSVRAATSIRRRLIDMGLLPGVELEMHRVAPLGDPIDVKLKGFHLSLRKSEAATIAIERI